MRFCHLLLNIAALFMAATALAEPSPGGTSSSSNYPDSDGQVNDGPVSDNQGDVIRFTCAVPQELPEARRLERYYEKAFASLGYDFEMEYRPARRSIAEAVSGASDGECARVIEALNNEELDQLTPIDVVVGAASVSLWSKSPGVVSLDRLANPDHTVCYVESNYSSLYWIKKIKENYPSRTPIFYKVPDYATAVRMLSHGRLTHCIGINVVLQAASFKANLSTVLHDNGALGTVEARPLLNKNRAALTKPFTAALQKVVNELGVIDAR